MKSEGATMIASLYDLEAIVEQHQDFDFEKQSNEWERKFWPERLNIKSVSLGPGIYCGYFSIHALFSKEMPVGDLWVLSIKLKKYNASLNILGRGLASLHL